MYWTLVSSNWSLLTLISFFLFFLAGWFFDFMQSYDLAFYFSGVCVLLGGFLLVVSSLPCWPRPKGDTRASDEEYTNDLVAAVA